MHRKGSAGIFGLDADVLDACRPSACGANSPLVNAFPINGLHPDGCKNADGDSLRPVLDVKDASKCKDKVAKYSGVYLDYAAIDDKHLDRGYELVARGKGSTGLDEVICKRDELVGAVFEFSVHDPKIQTKYRIGHVAKLDADVFSSQSQHMGVSSSCRPSEARCAPFASLQPVPRVAYLITPVNSAQSVCMTPPPESSGPASHAIIVHLPPNAVEHHTDGSQSLQLVGVSREDIFLYSMVVPGAVYDYDASLLEGSFKVNTTSSASKLHSKHQWFNLACANDALAQTERRAVGARACDAPAGSSPCASNASAGGASMDQTEKLAADTACARLPALHMFTAKYYEGRSATIRGTEISWCWGASVSGDNTLEAVWGISGAECLAHSRLWIKDKIVYVPPQVEGEFSDIKDTITEREFLKRICMQRASAGVVRDSCPDSAGKLVSFTHDHSPSNNTKSFSTL